MRLPLAGGSSWWYAAGICRAPRVLGPRPANAGLRRDDLCSQIFLNGVLVGSSKDAMSSFAFDVKGHLRKGTNNLVVRVTSGTELFAPGNWEPSPSAAFMICGIRRSDNRCANRPSFTAGIGAIRCPTSAYGAASAWKAATGRPPPGPFGHGHP